MDSLRIRAIASDISLNDVVLDLGCDHGYLSIYLKENNLCKEVYASDISPNALAFAQKNIQKSGQKIQTFLSDGFENIPVSFNTVVIAGMGTSNILSILEHEKCPNKLVLASNNDYYKLRSSLNKKGFKIVDEQAIYENKHYYIILLCIKGHQHLKKRELKFGISNNEDYYAYLMKHNLELIPKVPWLLKIKLKWDNVLLKGLIEKK